jgi:acyl-CoA synthetase (AMP-forming)/AMP-acid ligase II/acyl carrier protein
MDLVRRFQAALPEARLINLYGSSEVAADVTWYDATPLAACEELPPAQVPIGQPIDGVRCYILDEGLQPVPPGVVGELYIGGDCLARGYRGRPDLTRERFIANPFAPGRLFRTGDRARWRPLTEAEAAADPERRPDIEYLGRRDSQIKLRGFRIELGEIEAGLRGHPDVDDALVLLQDHPAGPRLVACVAAPTPPEPAELHRFLAQSLPPHMLPSGFVLLERLPLTPNGKLDRQALAGMAAEEPRSAPRSEAPATELEVALAAIWAEVLGRDGIGRDDDFFLLGGHSLLATRIITRIHVRLGIELPIRALFDRPTIAGLAQEIEQRQPAAGLGAADDDEIDLLL